MLIGWCAGLRGTKAIYGHSPCLHCDCGEFWHVSSLPGRMFCDEEGDLVNGRPDGVCENCRRPLTLSATRTSAACAYVRLQGGALAVNLRDGGVEVQVTQMVARMLRPRVRQIRHRQGR